MGVSLGLGWLARLLCTLGGLGVSMSICLFVFALGDCFLGAWWAGQLPGFWELLRLCLSRVAGWGSPVQCLRLWVALGLGVGRVAGAFVLLNRPCYHDIKIKELKFF